MSMQENWHMEIPHDTARVGREILEENDPYRLVRDRVNAFLALKDYASLYSKLRRGPICPIILSLITLFPFLENIPDRVAVNWAVTRIDWKYALHLPLTWTGSAPSVSSRNTANNARIRRTSQDVSNGWVAWSWRGRRCARLCARSRSVPRDGMGK
jgi:hypothetical protein